MEATVVSMHLSAFRRQMASFVVVVSQIHERPCLYAISFQHRDLSFLKLLWQLVSSWFLNWESIFDFHKLSLCCCDDVHVMLLS
jgi:hypothetical protein